MVIFTEKGEEMKVTMDNQTDKKVMSDIMTAVTQADECGYGTTYNMLEHDLAMDKKTLKKYILMLRTAKKVRIVFLHDESTGLLCGRGFVPW